MVFMPPGSAKSYYANVMLSAWYVGANPGKKLITSSYSQEVADKWGRRVREIVKGDEYRDVFDVKLSDASQAAGRWELDNGSEYYAVGVGGSVTSYRADLAIIDDPVKGREEADSETIRRKTIEWYQSDLWTRLKPGAKMVLIMTRWHEEDLAGWLLEQMSKQGEKWKVLSLPMEAEEGDALGRVVGEPLWPEWFTDSMLNIARQNARNWAALYQQRPAPEEGDFFKREWFGYYDIAPKLLRIAGASDYAVTANGGDYTVHIVMGVDADANIYILDIWRRQTESDIWIEAFLDLVEEYKPLIWAEEAGQINKSLGPFIKRRMLERKVFCDRRQLPSVSDKATRVQSFRARASMGKVYLPKGKPWVEALLYELLTFPAGKHDDQVDVLGLLGRLLDKNLVPLVPEQPQPIDFAAPITYADLEAEHDSYLEEQEQYDEYR